MGLIDAEREALDAMLEEHPDWDNLLVDDVVALVRAALAAAPSLAGEREAEFLRTFRWAYALNTALALRCLKDAQNDAGEWPMRMDWSELVGSSRAVFLRRARVEAGITDHDQFLAPIRRGRAEVDDIYSAPAPPPPEEGS